MIFTADIKYIPANTYFLKILLLKSRNEKGISTAIQDTWIGIVSSSSATMLFICKGTEKHRSAIAY